MPRKAWGAPVVGFLLLLATCLEGSAAEVGDRVLFLTPLVTTIPTRVIFDNPPYFVRPPDAANTHGSGAPTTCSTLITLATFRGRTFRILALDQIRTGRGWS
jgi:hypothetical protein